MTLTGINGTIQERRLDFINSELYFYINNPEQRSVDSDENGESCYYRHPDGTRRCLIGRYIPDELYSNDLEGKILRSQIFKLLPSTVKELGIDFLSKLQQLHDSESYWSPEFNELGKEKLSLVIQMYCTPTLNEY